MSFFKRISLLLVAILIGKTYKSIDELIGPTLAPSLSLNQWWGEGEAPTDWNAYIENSSEVINNKIHYPQATIDELREELNRTLRLAEPLEGINFEYGYNTKHLREIINYWRDDYLPRWRAREVFLWQFNQFTTEIQGLRMHFLHLMVYDQNKVGKNHYPVLLLHGWPSSVLEFYQLIHKLHQTNLDENNKYIFNVVVPSLPGFAWSQGTSKTGLGTGEMAVIFHNLMLRLGYNKYFIHGTDWGSVIGANIATLFQQNVMGYHSSMCNVLTPKAAIKGLIAGIAPSFFAPKEFHKFFPLDMNYMIEESGYMHIQATKPDTIGSALTANPIGLLAYLLEKFSVWTNPAYRKLPDGGLTRDFKLDILLDNVMIYYLTNCITTSQRIYAESFNVAQTKLNLPRVPIKVPTGCARFKHDVFHFTDYQLRDKYTNLIHSTYYSKGGHFAALELPNVVYKDFIDFVKKVEKLKKV